MADITTDHNTSTTDDGTNDGFSSVYGPVNSWRFGRSLGIDPIGPISTCSFGCVYCQLGTIQQKTDQRRIFLSTEKILRDLSSFAPWNADAVTFSGNGEPTLALNLGELVCEAKEMTNRQTVVLTNSSLLFDAQVRLELAHADVVCAKLDAPSEHLLKLINRPIPGINLCDLLAGLTLFRQTYTGRLAIQTMMIAPWDIADQSEYIHHMRRIQPDEIQLNTPTRPRSLRHQIEARGNHTPQPDYDAIPMKTVSADVLQAFAQRIEHETQIPVRCVPLTSSKS
jgi:wyosine [tRNA(Phe)-imidazoG37] synthetase (radical SAM superfamily)